MRDDGEEPPARDDCEEPLPVRPTDADLDDLVAIDSTNPVGPIGDGEHTSGEWVDVASVRLVARVLEAAARRYCG